MTMAGRVSRIVAVASFLTLAAAAPASSAPAGTHALLAAQPSSATRAPSALPAAVPAGLQWSTPAVDVSAIRGDAFDPQVALSADGTHATAVWIRSTADGPGSIQSASATISGGLATWGPVSDLVGSDYFAGEPQIALSADGTHATAVWSSNLDFIFSASASIRGNTATWGAAVKVSTIRGHGAAEPQISLSADGTRAAVIWYWYADEAPGAGVVVASATIAGNIATWGALSKLSSETGSSRIALSADGGSAVATWIGTDGVNHIAQASSATITGNSAVWSPPANLSASGGDAGRSQVAMSADGVHATVIWTRNSGAGTLARMQAASATITGTTAVWGTPAEFSAADGQALRPHLGLSADGTRATAIWYWGRAGQGYIAQAASATIAGNNGTWGPVSDLSAIGDSAVFPQISLSRSGTSATATWFKDAGSRTAIVQASSATIAGSDAVWSAPIDLSVASTYSPYPQVELSADGATAVTVWFVHNGTNLFVQSAVGVARPPGAPTDVFGLVGDGHVAVSWSAPVDDGGASVTGYTVIASPGGATCTTAGTSCVVVGLTNAIGYTFTVTAMTSVGDGPASSVSAVYVPTILPLPTGATEYVPVGPARLVDTRPSSPVGVSSPVGACTTRVQVAGRGGVPLSATAAVLTITVDHPTAPGWVAVFPAGASFAGVSNVNFAADEIRANSAIVELGVDGAVDVRFYEGACTSPVIVDVTGAFVPTTATAGQGRFEGTGINRVLDTRSDSSIRSAGAVTTLSPALLRVPADALAVAVNITVADTTGPGFVAAYPAGAARGLASTLNADAAGDVRAGFSIQPISAGGLSIYQYMGANLIVDVVGYMTGTSTVGGAYVPAAPARVVDTRPDHLQGFASTSWAGIAGARAVVANWTITESSSAGWIAVRPSNATATVHTSTVNAETANENVANLAITPMGPTGITAQVGYTNAAVIADYAGYFTP